MGLPVLMAVLSEEKIWPDFDCVYGLGCRAQAAGAAVAAIPEAAQSRVSNIAAARDDFPPPDYRRRASERTRCLAGTAHNAPPPSDLHGRRVSADDLARAAVVAVLAADCDLTAVRLPPLNPAAAVVRLLSNELEDRATNPLWRPGRRAWRAIRAAE